MLSFFISLLFPFCQSFFSLASPPLLYHSSFLSTCFCVVSSSFITLALPFIHPLLLWCQSSPLSSITSPAPPFIDLFLPFLCCFFYPFISLSFLALPFFHSFLLSLCCQSSSFCGPTSSVLPFFLPSPLFVYYLFILSLASPSLFFFIH